MHGSGSHAVGRPKEPALARWPVEVPFASEARPTSRTRVKRPLTLSRQCREGIGHARDFPRVCRSGDAAASSPTALLSAGINRLDHLVRGETARQRAGQCRQTRSPGRLSALRPRRGSPLPVHARSRLELGIGAEADRHLAARCRLMLQRATASPSQIAAATAIPSMPSPTRRGRHG